MGFSYHLDVSYLKYAKDILKPGFEKTLFNSGLIITILFF